MEERDPWGENRVAPEGLNFFPKDFHEHLFVPNFTFTFTVRVKFGIAPFYSAQYATACDQGLSAETCNAS